MDDAKMSGHVSRNSIMRFDFGLRMAHDRLDKRQLVQNETQGRHGPFRTAI